MADRKKIDFPPFILIINGVSCAGKTTIAEYFLSRYKNVFSPRGDKIKWMISDYKSEKYKSSVVKMVSVLIEQGIKEGFSIVHDWGISSKQRVRYKKLAKKYNMTYLEIGLECDFETISKRFNDRIEAAEKGAKISLLDPVIMKNRYEEHSARTTRVPLFDSGKLSTEQISKKIISLLRRA